MSEEQSQVVVDFRGGGHRGTGIHPGTSLFDGDGGGETLDVIDIGLFHLVEKLSGVVGDAFDVLSLAFGVNRVEGQGGFARTAQTRDDHEFVARNLERQVFQVMLSRAADLDEFLSHIGEFSNRTIRVEYRVTLRDANKRLSAKTRIAVDG